MTSKKRQRVQRNTKTKIWAIWLKETTTKEDIKAAEGQAKDVIRRTATLTTNKVNALPSINNASNVRKRVTSDIAQHARGRRSLKRKTKKRRRSQARGKRNPTWVGWKTWEATSSKSKWRRGTVMTTHILQGRRHPDG